MKKFWIVLAVVCLLVSAVMSVSAAEAVVYGDADGNGRVNNKDLGMLQQYLNEIPVDIDLDVMDVNDDGKVNNKDLGLLQQFLNEWEVTLGPATPDLPEADDNIFNDVELDWT